MFPVITNPLTGKLLLNIKLYLMITLLMLHPTVNWVLIFLNSLVMSSREYYPSIQFLPDANICLLFNCVPFEVPPFSSTSFYNTTSNMNPPFSNHNYNYWSFLYKTFRFCSCCFYFLLSWSRYCFCTRGNINWF